MRRHQSAPVLTLAAVAVMLSACGSGSGATTAASNASPAASSSAAAGSPQSGAAADVGAAGPANKMGPEPGGGANDGPDAKLPQGLLEPAASAAGMGKDGNLVVSVTSTDTTCMPDKRTFPAGTVWFKMTNHSPRINEMYLETTAGEELIEVEKIKTGASGAFKTTVKPGNWVIACEPGMADQQVLTGITATE